MADSEPSALSRLLSQIGSKITETSLYQQLRAKWDELDPQVRSIVTAASVGLGGLVILLFIGTVASDVGTLRQNTYTKMELVTLLRSANVEMSRLKAITGGSAMADAKIDWNGYFTGLAGQNGLDPANLKVGAEKPAKGTATADESLLDLELKHVSIKQLLQFAVAVDQGHLPVRLRNLKITTESPEGYLDSTLSVSGFKPKK